LLSFRVGGLLKVACAVRAAPQLDEASSFEDAVGDGLGEVVVVEDPAPLIKGLVGGEDHGPPAQVAVVDDLKEDVGGVGAVGEVADFVDDQDVGRGVGLEGLGEGAFSRGGGEAVDEGGGGGEAAS